MSASITVAVLALDSKDWYTEMIVSIQSLFMGMEAEGSIFKFHCFFKNLHHFTS